MLKQFMTSKNVLLSFVVIELALAWRVSVSLCSHCYVLLQPIVANLFLSKSGEGLAKEWKSAANSAM